MPMAPSLDAGGWFASGPGLFRKIGSVLLDGAARPAPVQKLIVLDDAFAAADPDIAALMRHALAEMAPHLPAPVHDIVAPEGLEALRECFRVVQGHEIWQQYGDFVTRHQPKFGPGVRERMAFAATVTAEQFAQASEVRRTFRARAHALAAPGTLLALPTSPSIAPRIDTPESTLDDFRARVIRMTCIASLSGLPQITIPVGTVAGCPAGLSFIGWAGGDETLLDLAVTLARHCGLEA